MNMLIVYDSQFGNTKTLAEVMAQEAKLHAQQVTLKNADNVGLEDLKQKDLFIFGSPTQGGRAKQSLQTFLDMIPQEEIEGKKFAVFDTRFLEHDVNFVLKLLIKIIGYAAPKMSILLRSKGGKEVISPEGFAITGKEGPLKEGEIERARKWIKEIIDKAS